MKNIDLQKEYLKYFNFRTKTANNIRLDILKYSVNNLNKSESFLKLCKYIKPDIALEIIDGVVERTLLLLNENQPEFMFFLDNIYNEKIKDICSNLDISNKNIDNQTLIENVSSRSIDPYFVAFMTPQQLHPKRWLFEMEKRRILEDTSNSKRVTDIYTCRKCKNKKSTTMQMQTRSSDEPMTIFVTCLVCYNTFTTC